jgi:hypothetical protein
MKLRFPLPDIKIEVATEPVKVKNPVYSDGYYSLSQNEFSMDVDGVASYYVSGGNYISICLHPGADINAVELYLNGSAYGVVLHQRKILPLHGSSFKYNNKGIMICGEAGAGKSSLTAVFCMNGGEFFTDDITPIQLKNMNPYVWPLSDRIKLWADSLIQLGHELNGLNRIDNETDKFYFPLEACRSQLGRLDQIYILKVEDRVDIRTEELSGFAKFEALRNEIYRFEYLQGMPENEIEYFGILTRICNCVRAFNILRPKEIEINHLMFFLREQISIKD